MIAYACSEKTSALQIFRNVENTRRNAGYTVIYSGKAYAGEVPVVTAREASQWIQVAAERNSGVGNGHIQIAVKVKEMEQVLGATAETLEAETSKTGHVAVYGINFDTGESTLKPESEEVLSDVLTLHKKN
jgi:outer membrane protein OmpA-like peptidoglycan-associated protein